MATATPVDHDPFAADQPVVYSDTGASVPDAQAQAYRALNASGAIDKTQSPGSVLNPYGQLPGAPPPTTPGQAYLDPAGNFRTVMVDHDPFAPVSTGEDVARSIPTGLIKGGTGTVGLAGDLDNLWTNALTKGVQWVGDQFGAWTPAQKAAQAQDPNHDYAADDGLVSSGRLNRDIQNKIGAYYEPQTTAGHYAETISSFAPAALFPGGPVARVLRVVVPGAASEGAGQITKGTPYEGAARFGGGLVGGLGLGAVDGALTSPQRLFGQAGGPLTDAQIQSTQSLMRDAQARGVPLTVPEAVQQVTGGATGLGRMQRVVESTRRGGAAMGPQFAARPGQVQMAVTNFADQIGPQVDPEVLGTAASNTATSALRGLDAQRAALTRPSYAAAEPVNVDPGDLQTIHDNIAADILRDKTGKISPVLQELKADLTPNGQPLTDIGSLDTIRKLWRDRFDLPPNASGFVGTTLRSALSPHLDNLNAAMEAASPDFVQGKDLHALASNAVVDPANNGVLGKIAGTTNLGTQTGALFPTKPPVGMPDVTARALGRIGAVPQSPTAPTIDIGPALVRQHILNNLNEANADLQGGANQFGGAKFVKAVASNPEQRATLQAGVNAVSPQAGQDLPGLLDVLGATGKRQQQGSMTAFNESDLKGLDSSKIGSFLSRAGDPLEWGTGLGNLVKSLQYKRNIDGLVGLMNTSPDDVAQMLAEAQQRAARPGLVGPFVGLIPSQATAGGGGKHP